MSESFEHAPAPRFMYPSFDTEMGEIERASRHQERIREGELKTEFIFETETVMVFPSKEQVSKGHLLVVPKNHYVDVFDIEDAVLKDIISLAKESSMRARKVYGATGVNLLHASGKDAQQSVFHFHLHVVPRYPDDGLDMWIRQGL